MHDSIGFNRTYTLYSDPSSEKRCSSLQQPRLPLRERSIKVTLPVICWWWWPPVLVEYYSHKKRSEKYHAYVKLKAFAGACVQRTCKLASFRISVKHNYMKVVKYYDLLLLSHLQNASITRRTVSTNLGPVSREVNTFRAYYGCHKSRPIFKMTTFHFKSSNFTINPLFSHLKHVARPHFRTSFLIGSLSRQLLQRPTWLALKTIDPFKKKTIEKIELLP